MQAPIAELHTSYSGVVKSSEDGDAPLEATAAAAVPAAEVAAVAPVPVAVEAEDAAEASGPSETSLGANWHPRAW